MHLLSLQSQCGLDKWVQALNHLQPSLPWQAWSPATVSPGWPPHGEWWEGGSQLFLWGHLPSQQERNIKRSSSADQVAKHVHNVLTPDLPFFPVSPHRPLLDASFDCVLIGQVGFLLRITSFRLVEYQWCLNQIRVSFCLLQHCWCCFAGPLAVCYSSVSLVAGCSFLYDSSSVSSSSWLEFAVEVSRRMWWMRAEGKRVQGKTPLHEREHLYQYLQKGRLWLVQQMNWQSVRIRTIWATGAERAKMTYSHSSWMTYFIPSPLCPSLVFTSVYNNKNKQSYHLVSRSDTVMLQSVPKSLPSLSLTCFLNNAANSVRQ